MSLFEKIIDSENLYEAFLKAKKGKSKQESALRFNFHFDKFIWEIQEELEKRSYKPGNYRSFRIKYPKPRVITAAPFRDRVVQHALCNLIEPLFEKEFISYSFANRKGYGTHKAFRLAKQYYKRYKYVLKCDIKKYFLSIDREILKEKVREIIDDEDTLWLIDTIIDSESGCESYDVDNLTLFDYNIEKGIPIGNLTSQFFANIYLNSLDHFVFDKLGCERYIRYVDDFILFHDDKKRLSYFREEIRKHLAEINLILHEKKQEIFPMKNGLDFLGYRMTQKGVRIRKSNIKAFKFRTKKRIEQYKKGEIELEKITAGVKCWIAHVSHGDSYKLRKAIFDKLVI